MYPCDFNNLKVVNSGKLSSNLRIRNIQPAVFIEQAISNKNNMVRGSNTSAGH